MNLDAKLKWSDRHESDIKTDTEACMDVGHAIMWLYQKLKYENDSDLPQQSNK